MSSIDNPWADAHKKHAILGVLGMKLRHGHIRSGLLKGVRSSHFNLILGDQVKIGMPRRDEDDLLLHSFQEEWDEQVEEMNVANDISLPTFEELIFESGRVFAPSHPSASGHRTTT